MVVMDRVKAGLYLPVEIEAHPGREVAAPGIEVR
jgi:hypothetical protein